MVKHGALSKSHVYHLLRPNNARVRHAAFTLLERSNPRLRTNSELFVEVTGFIWAANPSYDVYNEFTNRHFQASYKVHELISARVKIEKQNKQSGAADDLTANTCRRKSARHFITIFWAVISDFGPNYSAKDNGRFILKAMAVRHLVPRTQSSLFRSQRQIEVENLFLRHQLNIAVRRCPASVSNEQMRPSPAGSGYGRGGAVDHRRVSGGPSDGAPARIRVRMPFDVMRQSSFSSISRFVEQASWRGSEP
jgi:hypothetical protein